MKATFFRAWIILTLLGSALASFAQTPAKLAGRWVGLLDVTVTQLHLQLNFRAAEANGYQVTLDSLDQGAMAIPATVSVTGSAVTVTVDAIQGQYLAQLSGDGKTLTGTWKQMGRELPLTMTWAEALKPLASIHAEDSSQTSEPHSKQMIGLWQGKIEIAGISLRILFNIREVEGRLLATADSIDQGVKDLVVKVQLGPERKVTLSIVAVKGVFEGTLAEDAKQIEGRWRQTNFDEPLTLYATEKAPELVRPQEPVPPFPYRSEEVDFAGGAPGVHLAGTLTLPPGKGPFPAVVLVSGSGPQNRDSMLLGHKPFLVLADHLTRQGIAVLRYDERGVGGSTGEFGLATSRDFANDASAAHAYLEARPEVNSKACGILGHSEGGMIAPMVAAENKKVDFVIALSGPTVPGDQVIYAQSKAVTLAENVPAEIAKSSLEATEQAITILKSEPDPNQGLQKYKDQLKAAGKDLNNPQLAGLTASIFTKWMHYYVSYDPGPALKAVTCPMLALFGEKDLQVLASQNRPVLEQAVSASGNSKVVIQTLPGLNHLGQTTETGKISEYDKLEETMSPKALDAISTWLKTNFPAAN